MILKKLEEKQEGPIHVTTYIAGCDHCGLEYECTTMTKHLEENPDDSDYCSPECETDALELSKDLYKTFVEGTIYDNPVKQDWELAEDN